MFACVAYDDWPTDASVCTLLAFVERSPVFGLFPSDPPRYGRARVVVCYSCAGLLWQAGEVVLVELSLQSCGKSGLNLLYVIVVETRIRQLLASHFSSGVTCAPTPDKETSQPPHHAGWRIGHRSCGSRGRIARQVWCPGLPRRGRAKCESRWTFTGRSHCPTSGTSFGLRAAGCHAPFRGADLDSHTRRGGWQDQL